MKKNYVEGQLSCGVSIKIEKDVLDDWEAVELINDLEHDKVGSMVDLMKLLLGKKQYEQVKNAIKEEKGKIRTSDMEKVVTDIMMISQVKN